MFICTIHVFFVLNFFLTMCKVNAFSHKYVILLLIEEAIYCIYFLTILSLCTLSVKT